MQRKLELQREALAERERQAQGRTSVRATLDNGASNRPAANKPVARGSQSSKSGEDDGGEKSLWEKFVSFFESIFSPEETPEPASSAPQVVTMVTVPPTASPKPTPTPTPSPTPRMTERDRLANDIVSYAIKHLGAKYSRTGNTGKVGFDCSGLVRAACRDIGSGLKFGQGFISLSCEDGMAQDFIEKGYCEEVVFDYHDGNEISSLAPGDLVFFANPDDLSIDKHVAIATGNGFQVIEASAILGEVTDKFDAYKDYKGNGIYVRESGQVITYVIRPNYDWKEQP